MKVDYIIVGFGLAGLSFAEQLRKINKTFVVIDKQRESSSLVAGGMYNPVILKRFTLPWNSVNQLEFAIPFYKEIESLLNQSFLRPFSVDRLFNSIEEQNTWLVAADKPQLSNFLHTNFHHLSNSSITDTYKVGSVKQAGRLLVKELLTAYTNYLSSLNSFVSSSFNYNDLQLLNNSIMYQNIEAKQLVFAEGFGLLSNPYFNNLPLLGTKGETLTIYAPELQLNSIVKSSVFIIPQEEKDHYLIGATYHWTDKSWETTEEAKKELLDKLRVFLNCDFKVVKQTAGIRPTVKDRRPLVGRHPEHKNLYVLNGLGTRGVMVAPLVSNQLYNFIENNIDLDPEINITRF